MFTNGHICLTEKISDKFCVWPYSTGCNLFIQNDELFVSGDVTAEQAQALLDAHNPPAPTEPTVADKLALVGLSLTDLKTALGL